MFCSAVSWTLSFLDMLFFKVSLSAEGEETRLGVSAEIILCSCPSASRGSRNSTRWQETGGTLSALCSLGRLGFLRFGFACRHPPCAAGCLGAFRCPAAARSHRALPWGAAREAFSWLGADSLASQQSQHCSGAVGKPSCCPVAALPPPDGALQPLVLHPKG